MTAKSGEAEGIFFILEISFAILSAVLSARYGLMPSSVSSRSSHSEASSSPISSSSILICSRRKASRCWSVMLFVVS